MTTKIADRKKVGQTVADRLFSVYCLAKVSGYNDNQARRVAVQAEDRRQAGGQYDYAKQLLRIQRHSATGGKSQARTYTRLTQGRPHRKIDLQKEIDAVMYLGYFI
jgi:hypothetical protein